MDFDRGLGLAGGSLSPAVRRMVGMAAAETSFGHAGTLLGELADIDVGAKQVERHAEALGRGVARDEAEVVDPEPLAARTMYVCLDGTGVPMRKAETAARAGKQPDGSAKTREVKLVTIWSAEARDRHGMPSRDADSVSCNAAIESIASRDADLDPSPFAARVLREMERRGVGRAKRRVVLGDGAAWIWNFADEHLPGAVRIVDIFHAKKHIFDVAKAIYGSDNDLAAQCGKARRDQRLAMPSVKRSPLLMNLTCTPRQITAGACSSEQQSRDNERPGRQRGQRNCQSGEFPGCAERDQGDRKSARCAERIR